MTDQTGPKAPEDTASPGTSHDEFAKLLAASSEPKEPARGSVVKGTIVQIGDTDALFDSVERCHDYLLL